MEFLIEPGPAPAHQRLPAGRPWLMAAVAAGSIRSATGSPVALEIWLTPTIAAQMAFCTTCVVLLLTCIAVWGTGLSAFWEWTAGPAVVAAIAEEPPPAMPCAAAPYSARAEHLPGSSDEMFADVDRQAIAIWNRPCVDCGLRTGSYCDHCRARARIPSEIWGANQATPQCSFFYATHETG